ncbi:hypothetical protein PRZ48_009355 [Zasmidium cellare]|uniref:Uncharacterized protein n=1 Tax=Zasmidium cellare TaxID=395010 RepID=A0ABR0EBH2_ZASCE|nr:hypothetical protein PRZ48_009355 [Zasmidium cellare]
MALPALHLPPPPLRKHPAELPSPRPPPAHDAPHGSRHITHEDHPDLVREIVEAHQADWARVQRGHPFAFEKATDLAAAESSVVPGWTMAYSTYVKTSSLFTTTISVYTTFSTASVAVVKQNVHTNETNLQVTITPVYALGAPSPNVSTQYHWGGKVAQSGANEYGRMNYADLTGLPPVTDYENQPSCIMFGCSTILPTFNPTLVVPLALRTLAPEWADCDAALEGL